MWQYTLVGLLVPSLMAGQEKGGGSDRSAPNNKISEAVIKLLRKPRLGSAQLSWRAGRTQKGRILRVTDQFIAFETSQRPRACENVELSEIAAVQSLHTPGEPGAGSHVADVLLFSAFLAPFYVADAIANPFKRISPPIKPLRGSWEGGGSRGIPESSLEFTGGTVRYRTTTSKRGRWRVEHGKLHLTLDGEPEWIGSFHFECGELVLDNPLEVFREWGNRSHATAPVVGDWHGNDFWLNLKADGSLAEQKFWVREGTFENTSTSVRMQWNDSTGPGGAEWIAQIKHRRIVVSVSGVTRKYHYVPPFELDL
jgi:hypothetical protein